MEEVEDEPLFCERVARIDIGKAVISVTVRVPSETRKDGRMQETGISAPPGGSCWNWRTGCGPGARHRARGHVHVLERLGCKVTIESLDPEIDPHTGELITRAS